MPAHHTHAVHTAQMTFDPLIIFLPLLLDNVHRWAHEGTRNGLPLNVCTIVTTVRIGLISKPAGECRIVMAVINPRTNDELHDTPQRLVVHKMNGPKTRNIEGNVRPPTDKETDGGVARAQCDAEETFSFKFATPASFLVGNKDAPVRLRFSLQVPDAAGHWREVAAVSTNCLVYARKGYTITSRADANTQGAPMSATPVAIYEDVAPPVQSVNDAAAPPAPPPNFEAAGITDLEAAQAQHAQAMMDMQQGRNLVSNAQPNDVVHQAVVWINKVLDGFNLTVEQRQRALLLSNSENVEPSMDTDVNMDDSQGMQLGQELSNSLFAWANSEESPPSTPVHAPRPSEHDCNAPLRPDRVIGF